MADDKKKKYCLYLMANNGKNRETATRERFNRINGRYILVYSDKLSTMIPKSNYHIISEDEIGHLSDAEKVWLLEANVEIIAEETAKKQDEMLKSFSERISRLEHELEIESAKISKGQDVSDEE